MSKFQLTCLLLGLLLVAAPFSKHNRAWADEEYDDDEEEAAAAAAAPAGDDEKDVVVLTQKNFDDIIKKHKFVLAEFYAPWCGHCKTLKPHYAAAATALKAYDPEIVIGKVDATVESELGSTYGVQGYPTLKWFVDGEPTEYNGGRDTEAIIKWVKKKTGPPAVTVDSADKLISMEKDSAVIVLGYFTALEGDAYDAFKDLAQKTEDVVFAETTSSDIAKAAGLVAAGVIAIKNFPGEARETNTLSGDVTAESLKDFVTAEKMPLTLEFNQDNSDKIFNSGISKQIIIWTKAADLVADSPVWKAFSAVAKALKGKLVFVTVNNEGESHEPVTNFFGLKDAESPVVMGFWMEKNKKYRLKTAVSEDALTAFATSVLDGTAEADFKSAPIPAEGEDKDADVQIIVGKTVESIVKDKTKDVLLEVYAPWCGHCKQLEPVYKKLAKRFKKVDSVVIAKMDGTENEHPDLEVKGFPTIFFFPAGEDQTPISFESGDRGLKSLTKFIKQNAKVPYTLPKKGGGKEEGEGAEGESAPVDEKAGHDEL